MKLPIQVILCDAASPGAEIGRISTNFERERFEIGSGEKNEQHC